MMGLFSNNRDEDLTREYLAVLENLCYYLGAKNVMLHAQMTGSLSLKAGLTTAQVAEVTQQIANLDSEVHKAKTEAMLTWAGIDQDRKAVQRRLAPSQTLDQMFDRIERELAQQIGVDYADLVRSPMRISPRGFFEGR